MISTISDKKNIKKQKNNNTCLEVYLLPAGTQRGNLHQLSWTMSRMTYFILQANTGTGVKHSQHRKNSGEVWENVGKWTGRVEIGKNEIPGSRHSMHGPYTNRLQASKGEPLRSEFSTDGSLISASAVPHCRAEKTTTV